MTPRTGAVVVLLAVASSCRREPPVARSGDLSVDRAWATAAPDGAGGTLYFTLHNDGSEADTLLSVTVDSVSATAHAMETTGGMMHMVPLERPVIPARSALTLTPGHLHVMFEEPRRRIALGDTVRVALRLARHGTLTFPLVIGPYRVE